MEWDLGANSYLELWESEDPTLHFTKAWYAGMMTVMKYGYLCTMSQPDATNWNKTLNNQFIYNADVNEEIVDDPFMGTDNFYVLWRSDDMKTWVWIDPETNFPIYLQQYRADLKRVLVFYF